MENWILYFIIYLVVINIVTFLVMGLDKRGSWRVQESALFTFVIFGGGIGGILGMIKFHHKTKKLKFQIGFPLITILEIAFLIYFFINLGK